MDEVVSMEKQKKYIWKFDEDETWFKVRLNWTMGVEEIQVCQKTEKRNCNETGIHQAKASQLGNHV